MRGKITALLAAAAAAVAATGVAKWVRDHQDGDELELETPADAPRAGGSFEAVSEAPPAAPGSAPEEAPGEALDDLTAIKGLGKVKAARLVAAGVISYAQIAEWSDDDIAEMGLKCNTSPGQIKREDWVGQARALADGQE